MYISIANFYKRKQYLLTCPYFLQLQREKNETQVSGNYLATFLPLEDTGKIQLETNHYTQTQYCSG